MYIKEIEKPNISLPSPQLGFSCLVLISQFRNHHVERTNFARGSQCFDSTKESSVCWRETATKSHLLYDPNRRARAFIAKLLRKSPYEGRTRWREQGRKKPSGPARIAYDPHTGILSIARARCELKQLCCYINPDVSVKMSDVREQSEFD